MSRKLTITVFATLALVGIALGVAGVVPQGMKAEWDAYWQGLTNKYEFGSGDEPIDYVAPFLCDTFTVPHNRICDTMECKQGGYYNFFFADGEAQSFGLKPYKQWKGSSYMSLLAPDSSPVWFPGYLGKNVILYVSADDTATATGVCRIYWPYPPTER